MIAKKVGSKDVRPLKAVILRHGTVVLPNTIPYLVEKGYPCLILGSDGGLSVTTGSLEYWSATTDSRPIYEGDTINLEF